MRAAIVLRYYADLSVEEVAAALGKSPNTIKAQLQTGLDRLRVHLADPIGPSLREAHDA
jgi:DNA-directed RNA polymerase specialized sigma24 family protein